MSRDDSEFTAYLAARWPALVRTLVFLGHSERDAHAIALEALVRIYPDWSKVYREEDVEVVVYQEVLDARDRHLRRADRRGGGETETAPDQPPLAVPPGSVPELAPELAEQAERREEVEAALAAMAPGDRMVVVLEYVAELSEDQVADVLGTHVEVRPRLTDADVRLALGAVPVDPLRAQDVAERSQERRRHTWTRTGAVAVALVILVLAGNWIATRLDPVGDIERAANPLPVAWYANGTLHLADVTVGVRPVLQLVAVPDGVVLSNDEGQVLFVENDGEQQQIGDTVTGTPLVVEPDNGWVAWADSGTGDPELVVYDTKVGDEVGRRSLAALGNGGGQPVAESGPIAIDEERVHFRIGDTDFAWEPLPGDAFSLAGELVDMAEGASISRAAGPTDLLVQAQPFDTPRPIVGTDARLTTDGRYVMAVVDEDLTVYDTATAEEVPRMHSPSDQALSWTYAGDDTFLVTVLHNLQDKRYQDTLQMPDQGDYRIYECLPGRDDVCVEVVRVPRESPVAPVLAR